MTIDQKLLYENQGFLHLPGVIPPNLVERVRRGVRRRRGPVSRGAESATSPRGRPTRPTYDIPDILDQDECFVELVDLPGLLPVLLGAVGPDIQLNHTHARVFPPGKTPTAPWHSDLADVIGIDLAHSLNFFVKVHFYFEDLLPNQGCLGFIPGTHRLPAGLSPAEDRGHRPFARGREDRARRPAIASCSIRTASTWRTITPARRRGNRSSTPTHTSGSRTTATACPRDVEKYATNRLRRQMFGIEEEGVSYFDQRYDADGENRRTQPWHAASMRLMSRIRRATSITRR